MRNKYLKDFNLKENNLNQVENSVHRKLLYLSRKRRELYFNIDRNFSSCQA
ncbi:hypothetical protein EMIT036CA2_30060 [Chryseobacterium sp. IT-36CA2]